MSSYDSNPVTEAEGSTSESSGNSPTINAPATALSLIPTDLRNAFMARCLTHTSSGVTAMSCTASFSDFS